MCKNVAEALTKEYANVKEGVETVMGGVILDYEAKRILNQGIERGIEQERSNAIKRVTENYMKADPSLTREEAEERAKAILA